MRPWWLAAWAKPCVVGCAALNINYAAGIMEVNGRSIREGDFISIDGTTGEVIEGGFHQFLGNRPGSPGKEDQPKDSLIYQQFAKIMAWADEIADIGVRTNADTPHDATVAVSSAPPASASAAPNTCSSRPNASRPSAK